MAYFICEKQGRCCPHEFYDSIEQAITDSEDGVPCDHLIEVKPVVHGRWDKIPNSYISVATKNGSYSGSATSCSVCKEINPNAYKTNYCPNCGAKMDGGADHADD